ncbi:MAG TPA: hypothetical protein VFJ24_07155, partial [Gaiellales bacterium]|nr:hypothetical protein [Gaiellales bacterium]
FAHMQLLAQKRKTLEAIGDAADYRAKASPFPVTGLRDIAKKAAGPALVAATGHPWGAAALLAAPLAKVGVRAGDRALAQLVAASRAGQIPAQLVQQALEAGVPRGLVERLASGVATQQPAPDEAAAAP